MRGQVTLAVRGFLAYVVMGELMRVWRALSLMWERGMGGMDPYETAWLVQQYLRGGLSMVVVVLCGVAWRVPGMGIVVWMALVARLVAETGMNLDTLAGSLFVVVMYIGSSLLVIWAGWRVLQGQKELGVWVRESGEGFSEPSEEVRSSRVLPYAGPSVGVAWVGTALVFAVGTMFVPVIEVISREGAGIAVDGVEMERRWRALYVAAPLMGLVAVGALASKAWGRDRGGAGAKRELWLIAIWMGVVSLVNMLVDFAAPTIAALARTGNWGVISFGLRGLGVWVPMRVVSELAPLVFFVAMVWPAMSGGGGEGITERRAAESEPERTRGE